MINTTALNLSEFQIGALTRSVAYGLACLIMIALAFQSYEYGLYDLVFSALSLILMYLAGASLAWFEKLRQYQEHINIAILTLATLNILLDMATTPDASQQWLYPLGLICYLVLQPGTAMRLNAAILALAGATLWVQQSFYSAVYFVSSFLLLAGIAGMYALLHHNKSRSLVELSVRDNHTGAYNRKHLELTLSKEVSRSETTQYPLSLVAIEIDYYDQLKEMHGNSVLKDTVREMAKLLKLSIRAGDSHYIAQEEGNESLFYLLLPFTPEEGVLVIAERIRRIIADHQWAPIDTLTVSLGCTTLSKTPKTADTMLSEARLALTEAQRKGHNRVAH